MKRFGLSITAIFLLLLGSGCGEISSGWNSMCDWFYRTYHRKTISRLESTSTLHWTAEEKKTFPALYSIRRMKDLPDIPTAKWTVEEKNTRQLQFLNQFYKELENALNALRNDIVHWEREGTANRSSAECMKEQKRKAEDFLREGMAARKRGSYPVRVFGVSLTEAELREQLLSYNELRKRSDVQAKEHSRLALAAEEQLVLKRRLLAEKQQQLGVCRLYVERAKNKERIDNINAVVADIEKGMAATIQINSQITETFEQEQVKSQGQEAANQDTLEALEKEFL